MKISRYNYEHQFGALFDALMQDLAEMLRLGRYVLSEEVEAFEAELAEYLNVRHAIGVNSGTDALIIAMRALGIGPGNEVITQANTFNATVAAICLVGATPVLIDVNEDDYQLNPDHLNGALTERTRAVLPVHLYGKPAPMNAVLKFAESHDLVVIEDAAQAIGARYMGRRVGSIGNVAGFSFHPSKNLAAAGDAGAVVCNSDELAERVRRLRSLGQSEQNHHTLVGLNSKLDAIQARILSWKLPQVDEWNRRRRDVAFAYRERLAGLPLRFQAVDEADDHVFHLFQVQTTHRDALLKHLRGDGIDAVVRYPAPIHRQPAFHEMSFSRGQHPIAERLADQLLCLPIRPDLTESEIEATCTSVACFFGGYS